MTQPPQVPTATVLRVYAMARTVGMDRIEVIAERTGLAPKRILRAVEKLVDKGHIEFGVSARYGWITDAGLIELKRLETP